MQLPQIKPHLTTNNPYVRRQIIRDNLARLGNLKNSRSFVLSGNVEKRRFAEIHNNQVRALEHVNTFIKKAEALNVALHNPLKP